MIETIINNYRLLSEVLKRKVMLNAVINSNGQVARFINEGNPNTQDINRLAVDKSIVKPKAILSEDQQAAQVVKQALKDDQALAPDAANIHVTVKDGAVTLDGQVSKDQHINLATNTAKALGVVDKVNNRIEVVTKI